MLPDSYVNLTQSRFESVRQLTVRPTSASTEAPVERSRNFGITVQGCRFVGDTAWRSTVRLMGYGLFVNSSSFERLGGTERTAVTFDGLGHSVNVSFTVFTANRAAYTTITTPVFIISTGNISIHNCTFLNNTALASTNSATIKAAVYLRNGIYTRVAENYFSCNGVADWINGSASRELTFPPPVYIENMHYTRNSYRIYNNTVTDQDKCGVQCAMGQYSMYGLLLQCHDCFEGSYTNTRNANACTLCPPGSFSAGPRQTKCLPCPPGYFNPRKGSSSCFPCEHGWFANVVGTVECSRCPAGFVTTPSKDDYIACPAGTREVNRKCVPCESVFWSSSEGSTACENMTTAAIIYLTFVCAAMPIVLVGMTVKRSFFSKDSDAGEPGTGSDEDEDGEADNKAGNASDALLSVARGSTASGGTIRGRASVAKSTKSRS